VLILKPLLFPERRIQSAGYFRRPLTTDSSAIRSIPGNCFPRFPARRKIPAHAFELKKYRCGIKPVSSTCHNEHTRASLGQTEILGIERPPRDCSDGSSTQT
jgi:hypothetical protein